MRCLVFSFKLGAEYLDELSLVGVDVALHHFHARTEQSLKRRHVQHYLRISSRIPVIVVTVLLKSNLFMFHQNSYYNLTIISCCSKTQRAVTN